MKQFFILSTLFFATSPQIQVEVPAVISHLKSVQREFYWVSPGSVDSTFSLAWEFSPDQTNDLLPLMNSNDTAWFFEQGDNLFIVYWRPDVTIQSAYSKHGLINHWVYRSEEF